MRKYLLFKLSFKQFAKKKKLLFKNRNSLWILENNMELNDFESESPKYISPFENVCVATKKAYIATGPVFTTSSPSRRPASQATTSSESWAAGKPSVVTLPIKESAAKDPAHRVDQPADRSTDHPVTKTVDQLSVYPAGPFANKPATRPALKPANRQVGQSVRSLSHPARSQASRLSELANVIPKCHWKQFYRYTLCQHNLFFYHHTI